MYTLTPPQLNARDLYTAVVKRRQEPDRSLVRAVKDAVWVAYDRYEAGKAVGMSTTKYADDTAEALRKNFESAKRFGLLQAQLFALTRNGECPMCGYSTISDLDHYLPRATFPELSILPINLVPACGTCNNKKRNRWSATERLFLHAYFDDMPTSRYLIARVEVDADTVMVSYDIDTADNPQVAQLLHRHCQVLDLFNTFRRAANIELGDHAASFHDLYLTGGGEAVRDALARTARSAGKRRGLNDWKTSLYLSLSESRAFCDGGCLLLSPEPSNQLILS